MPFPSGRKKTRFYTLLTAERGRTLRRRAFLAAAAAGSIYIAALIALHSVAPPAGAAVGLNEPAATSPVTAAAAATVAPVSPTPEGDAPETSGTARRPGVYTLLVAGRDSVGLNTDTLMVARLDSREGTLHVVSIPRDTLVNVSWSVKKVNSIYGMLGLQGLLDGVAGLIGFPVDGYVIINNSAFREIIDCVGGIWFDVPMDMHYDDAAQGLHISLSAGYQHLTGEQCEGLVRFRQNSNGTGYADGDLGRIEVQHAFLAAAAEQLLSPGNLFSVPELVGILSENTDTDLTAGNIAFFLRELLKLDGGDVTFHTAPHDLAEIRGGSYVSLRLGEWLEMINTCLNPFTENVSEENLDVLVYDYRGFYSTRGSVPPLWSFFDYTAL